MKLDLDFYVDDLDNYASNWLDAHPERLFVLKNNKFVYIGGKGPDNYSINELKEFL